jgi:hypothetical protein
VVVVVSFVVNSKRRCGSNPLTALTGLGRRRVKLRKNRKVNNRGGEFMSSKESERQFSELY